MITKNILICVTGLTPQIVTETLYSLSVQRKIRVNELYIITTSRGRDVILGNDSEFNGKRGYPQLNSQLKKLCTQYKIKKPHFDEASNIIVAKDQTVELNDIRNDNHNLLFPNKICEVIRNKSLDGKNILHCSISGGRKTMSVDLAFAISLFGNINDKLYHVLVDEKVESNKDFWFPRNKKENNLIEISELPFVKLRSLLGDFTKNKLFKELSYTDLVELMQQQLKIKTSDKLYIDWRRREIWFGTNERKRIEPKLISFYRDIHKSKMEGRESSDIKELSKKFYNTYETKNTLSMINKLNGIVVNVINNPTVDAIFKINGPDEFGKGQYGILADTDKIVFID